MQDSVTKSHTIRTAEEKGTRHFLHQRITSVMNIPLIIFFAWEIIFLNGKPYFMIVERLSSPIVAVVLILMIASCAYHMKLGMQMVIEDYIHNHYRKKTLLLANGLFSLAIGAICILAILKIGFIGG